MIAKRFVQTPVEVAALREGVPRAVSRAVQQALARVAVDRHETAALFVTALNAHETVSVKPAASAQSLAILPFENLSADPDNQYFADGIARWSARSSSTRRWRRSWEASRASRFSSIMIPRQPSVGGSVHSRGIHTCERHLRTIARDRDGDTQRQRPGQADVEAAAMASRNADIVA